MIVLSLSNALSVKHCSLNLSNKALDRLKSYSFLLLSVWWLLFITMLYALLKLSYMCFYINAKSKTKFSHAPSPLLLYNETLYFLPIRKLSSRIKPVINLEGLAPFVIIGLGGGGGRKQPSSRSWITQKQRILWLLLISPNHPSFPDFFLSSSVCTFKLFPQS